LEPPQKLESHYRKLLLPDYIKNNIIAPIVFHGGISVSALFVEAMI